MAWTELSSGIGISDTLPYSFSSIRVDTTNAASLTAFPVMANATDITTYKVVNLNTLLGIPVNASAVELNCMIGLTVGAGLSPCIGHVHFGGGTNFPDTTWIGQISAYTPGETVLQNFSTLVPLINGKFTWSWWTTVPQPFNAAGNSTFYVNISPQKYYIEPNLPPPPPPPPEPDPPPAEDIPISSAPDPQYLFDGTSSYVVNSSVFEFWGGKFWATNKVVSRFIIKSRVDLPFVYHYGGAGHYKWFLEGWNNTEWIEIKTGTVEYTRLTEVDTEGAFIQTVIDQSTTVTTPYIKHRVRLWSIPNLEDGSAGTDQARADFQVSEIVFYT